MVVPILVCPVVYFVCAKRQGREGSDVITPLQDRSRVTTSFQGIEVTLLFHFQDKLKLGYMNAPLHNPLSIIRQLTYGE